MGRIGQDQMTKHSGSKARAAVFAGLLAGAGLIIAAPVSADPPRSVPRTAEDTRAVGWTQILRDQDGIEWTRVIDSDTASVNRSSGVNAMGVEWTRVVASGTDGVEWTRLLNVAPNGVRTETITTTEALGIEWIVSTVTQMDGSAVSTSTFVDQQGRAYTRRPEAGTMGNEWTRR